MGLHCDFTADGLTEAWDCLSFLWAADTDHDRSSELNHLARLWSVRL
ncbi:MAG: hypothetical protein AAF959_27090 [Cyanobacteria bacterium P01_D01_bin.56]